MSKSDLLGFANGALAMVLVHILGPQLSLARRLVAFVAIVLLFAISSARDQSYAKVVAIEAAAHALILNR